MDDCLIIGGGVIGLSLAYELAKEGKRVRVVDRGELGQEASWAGAGILPPARLEMAEHPYEKLHAISFALHREWADQLAHETGIDNGYRRCGGLYVARRAGEAASLAAYASLLDQLGIEVQRLTGQELAQFEPAVAPSKHVITALMLPEECQIRNPHHLQALIRACSQRQVSLEANVEVQSFAVNGDRMERVITDRGAMQADQYCICGGSWTRQLLEPLGAAPAVYPVRGQIVLFRCDQKPFQRVVNEGSRYLVPRDDGHVLAGSTEEEAGFDKRTTEEAITDLLSFATELVPALQNATIERTWAGLRPASFDGFPYLGRIRGLANAFVAAGHFRSGLLLSTGTARVMAQLICREKPELDLLPFSVDRA